MTGTVSTYPVIGRVATTAAAMRAAAMLIESAGIAGLSVTCDDDQISIQVCEDLGDPTNSEPPVVSDAAMNVVGGDPRHGVWACTASVAEATGAPAF